MQAGAPAKSAAKSGQIGEAVTTFKQDHSFMGRSFFGEVGKTWLRISNREGGYIVEAWQPNWHVYFINKEKQLFCKVPYKEVLTKRGLLRLSGFVCSGGLDKILKTRSFTLQNKTYYEYIYPGEVTQEYFLNENLGRERKTITHYLLKTVKLPGTARPAEIIYLKLMNLPAVAGFPISLYGHTKKDKTWSLVTKSIGEEIAPPPSFDDLKGLKETQDILEVVINNEAQAIMDELAK